MSIELPVIGRPLDNTALSAYMACPREYWLAMFLHRRGGGGTRESAPLAYGALKHKILEAHYHGAPPEMAKWRGETWWEKNGHQLEGEHRTLARGLLDYDRYRKKWGERPDMEIGETVGWPDSPLVELPFDLHADGLHWAGKIDRIINLGGLHYVEDHKTTSRYDKNYVRSFELSNQMMGYVWAANQLAPHLRIVGVRLNIIHILTAETKFDRQLVTFTPNQIKEWVKNTRRWTKRLQRDMAEWPTAEEIFGGADWPEAHYGDNGCSRKYGMCQYHELCGTDPTFRGRALEQIAINPWNPLEVDD